MYLGQFKCNPETFKHPFVGEFFKTNCLVDSGVFAIDMLLFTAKSN